MKWLPAILLISLSACAGVERSCYGDTCFLRATPDQVNDHCRKGTTEWDDGAPVKPGDGSRARCCTVMPGDHDNARYHVWVSRGAEDCIAHEECHIYEDRMGTYDHAKCDKVGFKFR